MPTPAEIEAQIEAKWQELEPVIEEYNGIVIELKASRAKAEALQKQIEPLQLRVDATMTRIGGLAVQAYKGGRLASINAMLASDTAGGLASNLAQLEVLARRQRADISAVTATRDQYANDKRALDGLITEQAAREAQLAAQRKEIEAKIADLQKLRQQAYGGGSSGGGNLKPTNCPAEIGKSAAGNKAAATACAQIGKMYQYGSGGPNTFDCSGLTSYAWASAGKSIPHQSKQQYNVTNRVGRSALDVGDLVFYYSGISHVGIYVGANYMVHASRAGEPVKMVSISQGRSPMGYGQVK